MKVGVFLSDQAPTIGGGFTFQDAIFQALIKLDSRHTFVIFSKLGKEQPTEFGSKRLQFVTSERGLLELARYKLIRIAARAIAGLPIIGNRIHNVDVNWLKQAAADLGIDVMWFVTPGYIEVDTPYIFTVWDLQHRLQPWFPEVSAKGEWNGREKLYANAIPRATAIIVGSEAGKSEIVQFYRVPSDRVKYIPLPTPRFTLTSSVDRGKEVLAKHHIPEGFLFYPAQFWPHKNHVALLLAVSILRKDYGLIFPVVFVGSDMGNLKHVRRIVDELDLSAQVNHLGFVSRDDLVGLYRNAFALTCLTFFGPDNLPPLEAFALGCPVIASNVCQEQLGDAALLVDPKNERKIAEAIKQLHDDPVLRNTLVSRGIARASKWTAEDSVRAVFSLIDEFEPVRRCWGR